MPRIPNTRPTSIYWLFDMRPETLVTYPNGRAFYCGKTVMSVEQRFGQHLRVAVRHATRQLSIWLRDCGNYVRIETVEIVPLGENWHARERFWISKIRNLFPGGANIADGGQGVAGYVHTPLALAKISLALKGRKHSADHCRKIGDAQRGKKRPLETCAKIAEVQRGKTISAEHRAKLSLAGMGKKFSPEECLRRSLRQRGKTHSLETRAKISAARRQRILSNNQELSN